MTNTIFGLMSLLFIVTIITLWTSCNRNNTKTETNTTNIETDTLHQTNDSLGNRIVVEDSLSSQIKEDSITMVIGDSLKNEKLSLKENKDETSKKEPATGNKNKAASDFKENINQQKTKSSGGIKAASNIKDTLTENKPKGRTIIIGFGGGVTGAVTTYKIYEDGSLFESNSHNIHEAQKKLKVLSDAKAIQSQFDALKIDDIKLNAPGNVYFFVAYEEDRKSHRCTWGANDVQAPENLKTFYDSLMKTISENK